MEFKFQKRRGIGNVITTLIILIASVILGAGVIFFGGSMFQTNTQSESVKVTNVHTWVANANSTSVTAFAIQNVGSKPITINSISMRGLPVPTARWYSCSPTDTVACANPTNINTELTPSYACNGLPANCNIALAAGTPQFNPGSIGLAQGQSTIAFVVEAGDVNAIDSGNTYALQIQAGQASAVQQVLVVSAN
jgi:hypothetical protein